MIIPTCPKCQSKYAERDNFCIECGKNLMTIKMQEKKNEKNRKRAL